MDLPEIAVYNFSEKSDPEVQRALRAINRQVLEDFLPIWGAGYLCRLKTSVFDGRWSDPEAIVEEPVTADAALYIVDESHVQGAAGYHAKNGREVPFGFVFTDLGNWTVTFSHEVLELIVDPMVNCFVPGPHPEIPGREVLHAYETCDAVESTKYKIDDVFVSNFVTPQYFSRGDAPGTRNDFLGTGVKSFGLLAGCHLGFIDLVQGEYVQYNSRQTNAELPETILEARKGRLEPKQPTRLKENLETQVARYAEAHKDTRVGAVLQASLRRRGYQLAADRWLNNAKASAPAH